jgi:RiboL-PSP-HEPN
MRNIEVYKYKSKLDNLFSLYEQLPDNDLIKSHWSRYLCIQTSGFVEQSVRHLLGEYSEKTASPKTASFAIKNINRFQNAKMNKIYELIGMFSADWESEFRSIINTEIHDHVDSIITNRHNIAHGKDVGISYTVIKKYYKSALKVIENVEGILFPEVKLPEAQKQESVGI